jgi:hypothetical protein
MDAGKAEPSHFSKAELKPKRDIKERVTNFSLTIRKKVIPSRFIFRILFYSIGHEKV